MNERFAGMTEAWRARSPDARVVAIAFFLTAAYAGAMFWLAPYPPMVDLPQHAGQIALLHDLLFGQSAWRDLVQINWFTPYLVGYALALPLSFLMPVVAALKLLLTLAYYAFVYCCVLLRREFNGDERLDWLFIPGFFGFAYAWGFFAFLIAAPFGLLFVVLAHRYAKHPDIRMGIRLGVAAVLLFFSHGLIFLFACGVAVTMAVIENRSLRRLPAVLLPFLPAAALTVAYAVISHNREAAIPSPIATHIWWHWGWTRLRFFSQVFGASEDDQQLAVIGGVAGCFMLMAPVLLRSKVTLRQRSAIVPFAALVLLWFSMPSTAMTISFLYERFAMFILPFYAFMFSRKKYASDERYLSDFRSLACQVLLVLICWSFLAIQTNRILGFADEARDFDEVRATLEPGRRALMLAFNRSSEAAGNPWVYTHYALWYQVENMGFVDLNFAWYPALIVRFRNDRFPVVRPGFEWTPQYFRWVRHHGEQFRYFFVRHTAPVPESLFKQSRCEVSLLKSVGTWSVYETTGCQ